MRNALLRRRDTERYDDRMIVRTNLIDAFDLLMAFVEKHLNDPFYQEGVTSLSLRSIIFRELVANIIAHREYTSAAPATMIIYADRVEFKNPNVPHYHGRIDPNSFTPFPKNPTICKFMLQMGRYEELGSGVRRVNQYLPHYAPGAAKPVFEDGEMFSVTVPIAADSVVTREVTPPVTPPVTLPVTPPVALLVQLLGDTGQLGNAEIRTKMNLKDRTHIREHYIDPALALGLIEMTIPEKPKSRLQKYRLTDNGRRLLERPGKDAP
jgi:ATP-dependent DNA helicase RecG